MGGPQVLVDEHLTCCCYGTGRTVGSTTDRPLVRYVVATISASVTASRVFKIDLFARERVCTRRDPDHDLS